MGYSRARVAHVADLTPNLRRIIFDTVDLPGLGLPGVADEAVGIYFPAPSQTAAPDMECRDGTWGYHDVDPAPDGRNYSIRAVDEPAGRVVVDFVIHDAGPATSWAQRAETGHEVVMSHARSWFAPPSDTRHLVLAADLAGLPALARIVEEIHTTDPARTPRVTTIVEVPTPTDLGYLPASGIETITLVGGNGRTASGLAEAMRALDLPATGGYCWFAGEAAQSRAVRKHLRDEHGWDRSRYDILGYWRQDSERWTQAYAQRSAELFAVYQQAIAAGRTEKEAAEEFDEALERAGL
ncbi:siderophore-interacting protein [Gordonia aurantiaca]|uniref:siderophore-interacting protein n=1 Tax=Gordonia sp. B21 TaxID=3151852 RepID=UPI003267578B